ncbi:hypothetical protein [Williamsia sp. 1135]|uniref:hypothetical protein n=1 Tax=Williamsia sp. 1135 TaxID=1889262 RepID=UPI000A1147AD|nr:hypothetical protein [Williamsia sp. 1135]
MTEASMTPEQMGAAAVAFGLKCDDCLGHPDVAEGRVAGEAGPIRLLYFRHDPTCPREVTLNDQ